MRKSDRLWCIKKACRINDVVFSEIVKKLGEGKFETERDVEKYILKRFKDFGAGYAYRSIVANNNSIIHAVPRDYKLNKGFLVLDFGSRVSGWCSDMTRTIFLGSAGKRERKLYELVRNCQMKCAARVRSGVLGKDLYFYSRKLLRGYVKYYPHALGHGVGWRVHVNPRLAKRPRDILKEGDVITIEPGIYIKNKKEDFGIRVEDSLLVKKHGFELLCKSPKRFIEIKGFS